MTTRREELEEKSVEELRETAAALDLEAVTGAAEMSKEELVAALEKALGDGAAVAADAEVVAEPVSASPEAEAVEAAPPPAAAPEAAPSTIDKAAVKSRLRELKAERSAALASSDRKRLKAIRRDIRGLKRSLRRAAAG